MLLKIRLLRILLICLFRKSDQDVTQPVETTFRITPFDLELSVTAASSYGMLRLLSSWDFVLKKCSLRQFILEGKTSFAYSETIRFVKATKLFDLVKVITLPIYWDEKMVYLQHKYYVRDELKAIAITRAAAWGKDGRIAPKDLLPNLGDYDGPIPEAVRCLNDLNDSMKQL